MRSPPMSALTPARPRPSPLTEPPALALCWYCVTAADRIDPPGWVTINPSREPGLSYTAGVCPACLATHHSSPYPHGTS
jgi:hypothetical protein